MDQPREGFERWTRKERVADGLTYTGTVDIASGPDDEEVVLTIGALRQVLQDAGYQPALTASVEV